MSAVTQALQDMTLSDKSPSAASRKTVTPSRKAALDSKASTLAKRKRSKNSSYHCSQYYGYDVSPDVLIRYGRSVKENSTPDGVSAIQEAQHYLRLTTGMKQLRIHLACQVDANGAIIEAIDSKLPTPVPILMVCSNSPSSFRRRPTPEQIAELAPILGIEGRRPRWWVDYYDVRSCVLGD